MVVCADMKKIFSIAVGWYLFKKLISRKEITKYIWKKTDSVLPMSLANTQWVSSYILLSDLLQVFEAYVDAEVQSQEENTEQLLSVEEKVK